MFSCYRRLSAPSIPPPSDLRIRFSRLQPVSVRSALCDGVPRTLRVEVSSRLSEPVVAHFQGGGGLSFLRVRSPSAKGIDAIGDVLGELEVDRKRRKAAELVAAAVVTVVLGTGNRVLYKLALVPLKEYPFFLAQFATFGYLVVYFSILYTRYQAGIVTDEMLSLPKTKFLAVGFLEALAAASGMAAGAVLSGASIPILSQTFLVWQLIFSVIFLKRRFRLNQLLGCFLVTIGVVITVASGSGAGTSLKNAGIFWSLLMILSFLFQAADTILKEIIFLDAAKKLKGGSLDLFIVNSFGSAFQAIFICLLMPFMSKLWGIPFHQLPSYIRDGTACFLNIGSLSGGCQGAPLLPILFVIVNMAFNISLLHLLKISSAVVSCLASTFSVPLSIYVFTLPLPYIGVASSLPSGFIAGAIVLVSGLLLYCWCPPLTTSTHNKVS
ncbi:protein CLT1, chloroplastic-like [Zingiber officinale]|uniref:protein CLT1, chloroplastic-like n=1 Tax=Zingiber officinale TaxID=94328 RepID=UPI001C4ABADA|nr:protein CLT1, chloroplastic-like [Zingiber officinale]